MTMHPTPQPDHITAAQSDPSLLAPWHSSTRIAYFKRCEDAFAWAERFGGTVDGRVVRLPAGDES